MEWGTGSYNGSGRLSGGQDNSSMWRILRNVVLSLCCHEKSGLVWHKELENASAQAIRLLKKNFFYYRHDDYDLGRKICAIFLSKCLFIYKKFGNFGEDFEVSEVSSSRVI